MGRIDLLSNFSFFEVPEQDARFVVKDMNGADWKGRRVAVEIASDETPNPKKKTRKTFGDATFQKPETEKKFERQKKDFSAERPRRGDYKKRK